MERSEISMLHVRMRRTGASEFGSGRNYTKLAIVLDLMHLDKAQLMRLRTTHYVCAQHDCARLFFFSSLQ